MKQYRRYRAWILITSIALLILGAVRAPQISQAGRPPSPEETVQHAWRLAQESGVYRFATEIIQTTYPAPSLANVGRTSRTERLHIEGQTDSPQRTLQMTLWKDGGSLLNPRGGVEVRVEGDRAQGRAIGGTWQTIDDFSGAFAPANDLLAYLVGAKNVRQTTDNAGQTANDNSQFVIRNSHFTFDVDGPAFAAYIRDQMEDQLRKTGELPAGLSLSTSDTYHAMTGQGEVWLDARGLPLRLTIHLDYPQQRNGERIEAAIQTDFANFSHSVTDAGSPASPTLRDNLRWFVTATIHNLKSTLPQLALGAGFLGLLALLLMYRRSQPVHVIFTCLMLASMIVGPLLQSQHVAAFYARVADQNADYTQRQQATEAAAEAEQQSIPPAWDPHHNPLETDELALSASEGPANQRITNYETFPVSGDYELPSEYPASSFEQPTSPIHPLKSEIQNPPDTDGDGLLYVHELRLGTDADNADSDGDQIRDDVEVAGFEWPVGSGKRWYTDPNNPDTNRDGLTDTDECWATYPPAGSSPFTAPCDRDTDGDRIPDLFDTDNDNDGVSDRIDLSPFRAMGSSANPFDYDAPFELVVDGLQANAPVFVDFQLRPIEEKHLTYALNVLDWPSGDQDGQVQRHTDTADSTFQTVAAAQNADSAPQDDNGDIRLVPMLEITIPYDGGYGNLPVKPGAPTTRGKNAELDTWLDTAKLTPYGISVRKKDNNGALAIYTPLNVVNDETGGGRVAFSGRMLYWPKTTAWGDAQQVRVVWLVLMLTDTCTSMPLGTGEEDAETWCDDVANWVLDRQQPVHTYTEDWFLTGLAVREDHGLDVAVVLEDPDDDVDTRYDDSLWLLASGLETAFVSGRDADDNHKRDVAITPALGDTTLTGRFDADDLAAGTTITDRWGIPLTATLHVETFSYAHQDYIAHIMMTETVNILNEHFTTATGAPKADAPTLLFAREEHFRSVNFGDADAATVANRRLTVTADASHAQEATLASVSWAPFRHQDGTWVSYPFTEYWDLMEVRFKELFPPGDPDDPDSIAVALGQVTLAKAYYLAIFNGISGLVWIGENRVWQFTEGVSDLDLIKAAWKASKGIGKGVTVIVTKIAEEAVEVIPFFATMGIATRVTTYLRYIGLRIQGGLQSLEGMFRSLITKLSGLSKVKIGLAVAGVVVAVAALAAFVFAPGGTAGDIIGRVVAVVSVAMAIKNVVEHGKIFVENMVRLAMGLKMVKSITDAQMKAGVIGLIVAAVVTFGAFIVSWIVSGVSFWSVAFNTMLAGAIATVVVAVIMLAITAIPIVGQIIAAIIALIDAVIFALCSAFSWDEGKVGQWVCKGISGLAAEGIRRIIYGNHVMINMDADDRLDVQNFQQNVFDPTKGIAVGNALAISATVTTTIELDAVPENWMAYAYYYQYNRGLLKSATFQYALQAANEDLHEALARDQIADWTDTLATDDKKVYIVRDVATGGSDVSLTDVGAGINRPVGLYLSEGQAIPSQECWSVPIPPLWGVPPIPILTLAPVCYIRTEKTTNHIDLGSYFRYDIFPQTLDDFYAPVEKDGGYSLAWGQDATITSTALSGAALLFPRQVDFDGDGLRNPADGGSDPDDHLWDLDGDGLSDYFESQTGSDPARFDTDGDGLGDAEEARRETDPNRRDSDGDGLTDWEEIAGWEFVYAFDAAGNPLHTWVTSDPASPDSDGDSLTDFQEKAFGFNPRVYSSPTVLTFESQVGEAGAPHLLLRFEEHDGATTFADSSGYGNVATCNPLEEQCPAAGFAGRHGNAPRFDGIDDRVTIPDAAPAGQPGSLDLTRFTIGAWVRPTQIKSSYQPIITKQDDSGTQQNYGLFIAPNSRRLYFSLYAGNCTTSISFESTGALSWNAWNHVMVTYDRSRVRIYLNGQLDQSLTHSTALCQNDEPVRIGGAPGGSAPFAGYIDEVAIFDRALLQAEVQTVMAWCSVMLK